MTRSPLSDNYRIPSFFVWRTPLLAFDEYLAWSADVSAPRAARDPDELQSAFDADGKRLRARLGALFERAEIAEAIFIASRSLHEEVPEWRRAPTTERGVKIERALVRYFARMTSRPTPFGLFAGTSLGTIGTSTQLLLEPSSSYVRHTRLDMNYVCALRDFLTLDADLRNELRFFPNSTLSSRGRQHRWIKAHSSEGATSRSYGISAVERTAYLDATLTLAQDGARPADLARGLLEDDPELSLQEARAYIDELIDEQILVSEIEPTTSGREPVDELLDQIASLPPFKRVHAVLSQVDERLQELDRTPLGAPATHYVEVAASLSALPISLPSRDLFQVDMAKPARHAILGPNVIGELLLAIDVLHRIGADSGDALREFRRAFGARYEGREVPLVDVLDQDLGIGFGAGSSPDASFLGGLPLAERAPDSSRIRQRPVKDALLLRKWSECLRTGATTLSLDDDDVRILSDERNDRLPLPDSLCAVVSVVARPGRAASTDDFQLRLDHVTGPSGMRMLGRFCHGDAELRRLVDEHIRQEQMHDPGALFAEVVHLPEGRAGNIVLRPAFREYEIPYLGRSSLARDHQIRVDDLLLSLSAGALVLRSKRLGRRIVPRMTNFHNVGTSTLPVYRFLRALEAQGHAADLFWDWGPLGPAPYLPRVTVGRTVLSRARWRLEKSDRHALGEATGAARYRATMELRKRLGWPRFIAIAEGDNEIAIDLDNVLAVDVLGHYAKQHASVYVFELFPGPGELCAQGPEGLYRHELVVPLVRSPGAAPAKPRIYVAPTARRTSAVDAATRRSSPPGSEWLYAKIYTGCLGGDDLLVDVVHPLVAQLFEARAITHWFFIRYSDPDHHLRLRFHGSRRRLTNDVLPALHEALTPSLGDGTIWRLQLDTYEREIERYGGTVEHMCLAEQVFWIDSETALSLIAATRGDDALDKRWRLALLGIHRLLEDLGLDLAARLETARTMAKDYAATYGKGLPTQIWLGDKYRGEQKELSALLEKPDELPHEYAVYRDAFAARSKRLASTVAELRALDGSGPTTIPTLATSFAHMSMNRLMRSAANAFEVVIYEFLARLYQSNIARARMLQKQPLTSHG